MRSLAFVSVLWALAARAVPAPQAPDAPCINPTLQGPDGYCSLKGEYWNGCKYLQCPELLYCRGMTCEWETTPLPAGVTASTDASVATSATGLAGGGESSATSAQGTASTVDTSTSATQMAGGADTSATSAQITDSSVVTTETTAAGDAFTGASDGSGSSSMSITLAQNEVQTTGAASNGGAGGSSVTAGTATDVVTTASGTSAAQTMAPTGTGATNATCVNDKPNELFNLTKKPSDTWKMTGQKCIARDVPTQPRFVAYWNQWADGTILPTVEQLKGVTHLVLSFAGPDIAQTGAIAWTKQNATTDNPFNQTDASDGTKFADKLKKIKGVDPNMKVSAAFGGWGLDAGFSKAANGGDMQPLAEQMVKFRNDNHLDGIDIDWEYPVGGGGYYKACEVTTSDHKLPERPYERDALVDLLRHIRAADPKVHLTIAVPGRKGDRELTFPKETIEDADLCLDEWNLMTYDMMNRRDDKTLHHAGKAVIKDVVDYYSNGISNKKKMNIGFPAYAKYFTLSNSTSVNCTSAGGLGCDIYPAEGAAGQDLGTSGSWMFNELLNPPSSDNVATDYTLKLAKASWDRLPAPANTTDDEAGASSWADVDGRIFWTWTSPENIKQSCDAHMKDVGGVMLWSINEDANGASGGPHIAAIAGCLAGASGGEKGSSGGSTTGASSTSGSGQTSATGASLTSASEQTSATGAVSTDASTTADQSTASVSATSAQ